MKTHVIDCWYHRIKKRYLPGTVQTCLTADISMGELKATSGPMFAF
jgi:hypothetical protein